MFLNQLDLSDKLILGFLGFLLVLRFLSSKLKFGSGRKTCSICGQKAKDELVVMGKERKIYCRLHLIEEFQKSFIAASSQMLVCEPNFQVCAELYACYPINKMAKFEFPKEDIQRSEEIISRLKGSLKCDQCRDLAQVVYFDFSYFPLLYQPKKKGFSKGLGPFLKELPVEKGTVLCANCASGRIKPLIESHSQDLYEGLYAPHGERCVFVSTYL